MRVIAGLYGGRRLAAPKGRTTRPTSEKVREAIYAMVGDVAGMCVLDLFAGSGALGIEALSRGAREAVFVERNRDAVAALRRNLAELGIDREHARVRREEAIGALEKARKGEETYDLILIDPPYGRASALGPQLAGALAGLLAPGGRVVVESDRRAPLRLELERSSPRERRYGDTVIAIHRHQ